MRPGVTLRIKRKEGKASSENGSIRRGSDDSLASVNSADTDRTGCETIEHVRLSTEDSGLSEMLISPSTSEIGVALGHPQTDDDGDKGEREMEWESKRLSRVSDITVAFGHA
jgi:hypothetical protein